MLSCSWEDVYHWVESDNKKQLLEDVICLSESTWSGNYIRVQVGTDFCENLFKYENKKGKKIFTLLETGYDIDNDTLNYIKSQFI